jgi:hypothetical protein
MKTAITIVLFLCAGFLQGQTDPLPIPTNAMWQMAWQSLLDGDHGTYAYSINGTTSVNDTIYYQVEQFSYCGDNIPTTPLMLIREESGKWYSRLNEVEPDELLFDFTLEEGESVTLETCFNLFPQPQTLTVVDIEDITMYDGSIRRMWTLIYDETSDFAGNTEYWIEGIGNMYIGLVHSLSFSCIDLTEWLHCYFENDDRKFPSYEFPAGIDCCNTVSISEQSTITSISLYPNPTSDELTIQGPLPISSIEISDFVGRIIYTSQPNNPIVEVDTELFSSGCYLVSIQTEKGTIEISKFIKQ